MFPDIIKKMHSDDYGVDGLEVHYDHTPIGTIFDSGEVCVYNAGETYSVPAGVMHQTFYSADFAEVG